LEADELGHVFEILAKNVLPASGEHGHAAHAKPEQTLLPGRVIQHVDGTELDAFRRKKLFRSQAAASAGLSEQGELIRLAFHIGSFDVQAFSPINHSKRLQPVPPGTVQNVILRRSRRTLSRSGEYGDRTVANLTGECNAGLKDLLGFVFVFRIFCQNRSLVELAKDGLDQLLVAFRD
jgi:hypothetical protein